MLEDNHGTFILDPSKIVTESIGNVDYTRIPGRLSEIGVINGNKRRYGRNVWEKNLAEGSPLRQLMARNATFGLLEHPKSGEIDLNSPIAVVLIEAKLEGNDVLGAFRILGTAEGNKLKALIEAGFNPTVSSRGFGSLLKAADGIDEVQDDYICEGWDVVLKPSFQNAVLEIPVSLEVSKTSSAAPAVKESFVGSLETEKGVVIHSTPLSTLAEAQTWIESISENFTSQKVKTNIRKTDGTLLESLPIKKSLSAPEKSVTESVNKSQQENTTVDIKTIKNQIAEMRQTVPSKLTPQRFAEGMARLDDLHQTVAGYISEDAKRSWEGSQLHDDIKEIENAWSSTAAAPAKEAARLSENYNKLVKVTKAVAETAVSYRDKAAKASKALNETRKALKETVQRGRAWVKRAELAEKIDDNTEYKVVCEALKKLSIKHKALIEDYNSDVTELGRTTLQLEFADKLKADAELTKKLDEAKTIEDIVAVREAITGIKETPEEEEPVADPAEDKSKKAPIAEKKKLPAFRFLKKEKKKDDKKEDEDGEKGKPEMAKKGVKESAPAPLQSVVFLNKTRDPNDLDESIAMVNRLSKSKQLVG